MTRETSTPLVVSTREELDAAVRGRGTVALVPTMGALHAGHAQLLRHGRALADVLVASIFVNPTQFAPGEDFAEYPRTFDDDVATCAAAGVDVVFHPDVNTVYPEGTEATITVDPGPSGHVLEGASRPTHFRGMLTVVAKLLGLVRPDAAVFGEKDFQQLVLVRKLAQTLFLGTDVIGCPIVREDDGLAMSSRNRYLSDGERRIAGAVHRALCAGADESHAGSEAVIKAARDVLDSTAGIDVDYLTLTNTDLSTPLPGQAARLLIAARVGDTRLLDNTGLTLGNS